MKKTLDRLKKAHRLTFPYRQKLTYFKSSGRMELLGNHTDHQGGNVLVGAISLHLFAAASPNPDFIFELSSEGYPLLVVNLLNTAQPISDENKTNALIRGVAEAFKQAGYAVGGINAAMCSQIPTGSGVSSSAAIALLIGQLLAYFYNDNKVSKLELALFAKYAENVYFNKPSGLLDQLGIALGDINYIDFYEETSPKIQTLHNPFLDLNFYLINTGGDHSDLTAHYAKIKTDMELISHHYGVEKLSRVDPQSFFNDYQKLLSLYGQIPTERALHYFKECQNVYNAKTAILNHDLPSFLKYMNASGRSSEILLRNITYPGDEHLYLLKALQFTRNLLSTFPLSAVRVHGGGFAGTVLVALPKKDHDAFFMQASKYFPKKNILRVEIEKDGLSILDFKKL